MTSGFGFGSQAVTPAAGSSTGEQHLTRINTLSGFSMAAATPKLTLTAKTAAVATPPFSFGNTSIVTPGGATGLGIAAPTTTGFGTTPSAGLGTGVTFGALSTNAGLAMTTPATVKTAGFSFGTPATSANSMLAGLLGGTTAKPAGIAPTLAAGLGTAPGAGLGAAPTLGSGLGTLGVAPTLGTGLGTLGAGLGTLGAGLGTLGTGLSTAPTLGAGLGTLGTGLSTVPTLGTGLGTLGTASTLGTAPTLGAGLGTLGAGLGTLGVGLGTLGTASTLGAGLSVAPTQASGLGAAAAFGGLGGLTTATSAAPGGLFGAMAVPAAAAPTVKRGLGGVDPKAILAAPTLAAGGKSADTKTAVKEAQVPHEICTAVAEFKKHVKAEKCVREQIARMSSKPMYRVQEEVGSLKQLCVLVSSSLQRNGAAIEKLKRESAQELKHAEIAQRTKETPPGLQYENTAPAEYFRRLVEKFEASMVLYRQQIDEMEQHLALMNQPTMLTPQELTLLLTKVQESFVSLASQLYVVHEAVKAQKEQYLNYRKVFHADTTDVFERRRRCQTTPAGGATGPSPFSGMSNAAAIAMVAAMNKTQTLAAPAAGLGLATAAAPGGLFNTPNTTAGSSFGGAGFGATTSSTFGAPSTGFPFGANTAAVRPLGGTTSLFGGTQATPFGTPAAAFGTGLGGATGSAFGATTAFGVASPFNAAQSAFPLQKPPVGNKRGKKA